MSYCQAAKKQKVDHLHRDSDEDPLEDDMSDIIGAEGDLAHDNAKFDDVNPFTIGYGYDSDEIEYGGEEDDGDYVYVVTGPKRNVSGLLISGLLVVSPIQEGSNPQLCRVAKCVGGTLARKFSDHQIWKLAEPRRPPLQYVLENYQRAKCEMDYEAVITKIVSYDKGGKIACQPPCNDGTVLVCNRRPVGLILGNPPVLTPVDKYVKQMTTSRKPEDHQHDRPKDNKRTDNNNKGSEDLRAWSSGRSLVISVTTLVFSIIAGTLHFFKLIWLV